MKIISSYRPGAQHVEIHLIDGAASLFDQSAQALRHLRAQPAMQVVERQSQNLAEEWEAGLDAIEKLAYVPSVPLHLEPLELAHALGFIAMAITISSEAPAWAELLVGAFASMIPCEIDCGILPSASEVWTDNEPSDEIFSIYEVLREWDAIGPPTIPLMGAFRLWSDLKDVEDLPKAVIDLIADLEEATRLYVLASSAINEFRKSSTSNRPS